MIMKYLYAPHSDAGLPHEKKTVRRAAAMARAERAFVVPSVNVNVERFKDSEWLKKHEEIQAQARKVTGLKPPRSIEAAQLAQANQAVLELIR